MKFNSQICTTREQSERLLTLGLKKETADMQLVYSDSFKDGEIVLACPPDEDGDIPAWSLHRLIEMMPKKIGQFYRVFYNYALNYEYDDMSYVKFTDSNIYDRCISCIECFIKEGYFPKEYLEE